MVDGDKQKHGGNGTDEIGNWSETPELPDGTRQFIKFKATDESTHCPALGLDNTCASHNFDKPWVCKIWPTLPRDIELFPMCSYSFKKINEWSFNE